MSDNRMEDDVKATAQRNPSEREQDSRQSLEELIKSNVALWFLGALAAGFSAGIGAVKWSDERYHVATVPIAEKDAYAKEQAELVELRKAYRDLQAHEKALQETVARQNTLSGSAKAGIPHGAGANTSPGNALAGASLSAAAPQSGKPSATLYDLSGFSKVSITISYVKSRIAEANLSTAKLGPYFKQVQLQACEPICSHGTRINYGYNLTALDAFRLAKTLQEMGISGFEEPFASRGSSVDTIFVYLED